MPDLSRYERRGDRWFCKKDGSEILAIVRYYPVWDGPFPCSGSDIPSHVGWFVIEHDKDCFLARWLPAGAWQQFHIDDFPKWNVRLAPASTAPVVEIAHVCTNGVYRPYPAVLCSSCKYVTHGLSVKELCERLNAAATAAPQQSDDCDAARVQRLEAQMRGLLNSLATSQQEVERLRAGNFTPQEFQNLCHGFDENDREVFVAGCLEYQRKLFGDSATAAPVEQSEHDSCSHWREGDSDNCLLCGDDLGQTTEADVSGPAASSSTSARAAAEEIKVHLDPYFLLDKDWKDKIAAIIEHHCH